MESFSKGLEEEGKSDDFLTFARLLVSQGNIYKELFKTDRYVGNNERAIEYYRKAGRDKNVAGCQLRLLEGYIMMEDFAKADSIDRRIQGKDSLLTEFSWSRLETLELILARNLEEGDDLRIAVDKYMERHDPDIYAVMTLTKTGDYDEALGLYGSLPVPPDEFDACGYYICGAELFSKAGKHAQAAEAYSKYLSINDSLNSYAMVNDVQFIEERNGLELEKRLEENEKDKSIWIGTFSTLVVLLIALMFYFRYKSAKNEKRFAEVRLRAVELEKEKKEMEAKNKELLAAHLQDQIQQIEEERDGLKDLVERNAQQQPQVTAAIRKRLDMLNRYFGGRLSSSSTLDEKSRAEISHLIADRQKFMHSNRLGFEALCPSFMLRLKECGLDEDEQDYACLYLLGINGKDIGRYLGRGGHYNLSSDIRKKLGIDEHDQNLGPYIRKLFRTLSDEHNI